MWILIRAEVPFELGRLDMLPNNSVRCRNGFASDDSLLFYWGDNAN